MCEPVYTSVYPNPGSNLCSVLRGWQPGDGVAGQVLQLQQEGPLPVGQQLQQHRVRVQTQRHVHPHVDQQGDVPLRPDRTRSERTRPAVSMVMRSHQNCRCVLNCEVEVRKHVVSVVTK